MSVDPPQPRPESLVDHAQRDRPLRRVRQGQVARGHVALSVLVGQPGALALVGAARVPVAGDDCAVVELPPAQGRPHREPEPRDALGERVLGAQRLARRGVGRRATAEDVGLGAQGAGVLRRLLDQVPSVGACQTTSPPEGELRRSSTGRVTRLLPAPGLARTAATGGGGPSSEGAQPDEVSAAMARSSCPARDLTRPRPWKRRPAPRARRRAPRCPAPRTGPRRCEAGTPSTAATAGPWALGVEH